MRETVVRVDDIAPISHGEGMALAEVEYQRFADMLAQLGPEDWAIQTVNTDWNVKQLVAHNVGFADGNASFRVFLKAQRAGTKRAKEKGYDHFVHGMNEVQVEEREHLSPDELVARWNTMWPKGAEGSAAVPAVPALDPPRLRSHHRQAAHRLLPDGPLLHA